MGPTPTTVQRSTFSDKGSAERLSSADVSNKRLRLSYHHDIVFVGVLDKYDTVFL